MSTAIVPGSLSAIAKETNTSIAEAFLGVDVIVIVDVSGSMAAADALGGRTRYTVACEELARLQEQLPGRIAVVAFNSDVRFVPHGLPPEPWGSTDLAAALRFVKVADGTVRFIVISDGHPDDPRAALQVARGFASPIDVIYCGPDDEREGREFLEQLARAAKGRVATVQVHQLAETVQTLMLGSGQ